MFKRQVVYHLKLQRSLPK